MWHPSMFRVDRFSDDTHVLTCGNEGMNTDLVFAATADYQPDHPLITKQRAIMDYIVKAVKFYEQESQHKR